MSIKKLILIIISTCFAYAYADNTPKKVLDIVHWQTKSGTPVYFVAAKQLPMVDINLAFAAGSNRDEAQPGLANLTANMLDQGTAKLSVGQIAAKFDQLGAIYNTSTDQDMSIVSLRTLSKPQILNDAVNLFAEILSSPSFPLNDFMRQQRNSLQAIAQNEQQPQNVADVALFKAIYDNAPYGHPVLGTQKSVANLTLADIKNFYNKYYVAKNAVIAIVGDLDRAEAEHIADLISSRLSTGNEASPLALSELPKANRVFIPFPSTQNYIRIGTVGVNRNDPDYFPLVVGNYTLGGSSMVSRLFDIVREKNGLTYGIFSAFLPLAYKGPFMIMLETSNKTSEQALGLSKQVLDQFINEGPTEQELKAARDYLIGSFPLRLSSNGDIAGYLLAIGFYHLPLDYLDTFTTKIKNVTAKQIQQAFQQHIKSQNIVTVVVGKNENKS